MKAIEFNVGVWRYIVLKVLSRLDRRAFYGAFSTVHLKQLPEPALPGDDWVKIQTTLGGICGSDLNLIQLHDSPSTSPFASMPFVLGHENLGVIVETGSDVGDFAVGERVVADPVLACAARGLEPCASCQKGDFSTCRNFTRGRLSAGMSIGVCQSTGGSWGEYFLAHTSQLIKVPNHVTDEAAILVDPLASALHPVMRHFPADSDKVLVVGAGIVGLFIVASLRALGSRAEITVVARHRFQGDLAEKLGANAVISDGGDYYPPLAARCGSELLQPIIGKRVVQGGFDLIYDCVGSSRSIDDSLRFTAPRGLMVLVGLAAVPRGVDWTPIWLKETRVAGVVYYGMEDFRGRYIRTYQLAVDLIAEGRIDISGLLTHTFSIEHFKTALIVASDKKAHRSVKVALRF